VNTLLDFAIHLIDEKEALSASISAAKKNCAVDIDSVIAMNHTRQNAKLMFDRLSGLKSREANISGRDYRLNNDGNQVSYVYNIKEVVTIDFDRNKVKGIAKALAMKSDDISATYSIDCCRVRPEIRHQRQVRGCTDCLHQQQKLTRKFLPLRPQFTPGSRCQPVQQTNYGAANALIVWRTLYYYNESQQEGR
jgi:hypothetical protein